MHKTIPVRLLTISHLLFSMGFALIVAHLCLSELVSPAIGYPIGFGLLLVLLIRLLITRHYIDYVLIIFGCSHFYYGNNHGGLWNYVNVTALLIYAFINPWWRRKSHLSMSVKILLWTLFLANTLGLLFVAESSIISRTEGFVISLSYGLLYLFILRLPAVTPFFKQLFIVVSILCVWNVVIALNQKLMLINVPSPLLPPSLEQGIENSGWETYNNKSERVTGSFHDFELLAEYYSLVYALFIPLVLTQAYRSFQFKPFFLPVILLGCLVIIIATATRSSIVLTVPVLGFYLFLYYRKLIRRPMLLLSIGAFFGFIIFLGPYIGLDFVLERLKELNINRLTSGSSTSMEEMNRGDTYTAGLKRLTENDWLIGYGYGTDKHYAMAMFGSKPKEIIDVPDYHNLYLSLPILEGWIGASAFIGMILCQILILSKQFNQNTSNTPKALLLGFIMFWLVFFVNEFKIQAVREPNYFMLIWCWLGFSALASRLSKQRLAVVTTDDYQEVLV